MATYHLKIQGMHCADCATTVERALLTVPGVTTAKVHYLKKQAAVETSAPVSDSALAQAVQEAGYSATPEPSA